MHDAGRLGLARDPRKRARLPSSTTAPPLGRLVAGQDLHQRRLAGAVFAEQPVDLARRQLEADVVQHLHRAEALDQL